MTPERLRSALEYNAETGEFRWKIRTGSRSNPGDLAGGLTPQGYVVIGLDGVRHKAHRLAWMCVHGVWPEGEIDHVNENKADNRISNLRDASRSLNVHNRQDTWSSTGRRGVYRTSHGKPYEVKLNLNGVTHRIGRYTDLDEASAAYAAAKKRLTGIDTERTLESARKSV